MEVVGSHWRISSLDLLEDMIKMMGPWKIYLRFRIWRHFGYRYLDLRLFDAKGNSEAKIFSQMVVKNW